MRINENDKVIIVNPEGVLARFEGKTGTVERIYPELIPPIAIVKFEEDETGAFDMTVKVPIPNLAKVEAEIATDIAEGAKRISRIEFKAALEKVTHPNNIFNERTGGGMSAFVRGVTTMIVGDAVETAIFKDHDGVVMTEDEFISELWSACNPVAISESVKKGMPPSKCIHVALTALIGLEEVVEILFGGSNG